MYACRDVDAQFAELPLLKSYGENLMLCCVSLLVLEARRVLPLNHAPYWAISLTKVTRDLVRDAATKR